MYNICLPLNIVINYIHIMYLCILLILPTYMSSVLTSSRAMQDSKQLETNHSSDGFINLRD